MKISLNFTLNILIFNLVYLAYLSNCLDLVDIYKNSNSANTSFKVIKGYLQASDQHYCNNTQSLKWSWKPSGTLQITNPPIDSKLVLDYFHHTTQIWIYNEDESKSQVSIQFLNSDSKILYNFKFLLNFEGWRRITRSYLYDMNRKKIKNNVISKIRVSAPKQQAGSLFFADWIFVKPRQNRLATQLMPDITGFLSTSQYLQATLNQVDIQLQQPTQNERKEVQTMKQRIIDFLKGNKPPKDSDIQKANQYYQDLNVKIDKDKIKGQFASPQSSSQFLYTLALDYVYNDNQESLQKAKNIIWLINDFGYSENSELVYGWYFTRNYFSGLLLVYSYLDQAMKSKIFRAIHWTFKMGQFWQQAPSSGWNSDFAHTNLIFCLGSILLSNLQQKQTIRWLKGFRRFLQRKNVYSNGVQGWLKPDGTSFHHKGHYIAYMYSFGSYINVLGILDETSFQINEQAYINFRNAVYNLLIMSNSLVYANSLCGRHPFQTKIPVKKKSFEKLAFIGGNILETGVDYKIAGAYNRIWGDNTQISQYPTEEFPQGFWQFNYSPIGVYRQDNWVATIHGINSNLWGTQTYKIENRLGRYQSYGAIQIIYPNENAIDQGYQNKLKGYNWNYPSGTTTKVLPFEELNPQGQTVYQKAASDYAAALRFLQSQERLAGKYGMYGFDFKQAKDISKSHEPTFQFKKTTYCFDGLIICLGSGITSKDEQNQIVSTIFQLPLTKTEDQIIVNGQQITQFPFQASYHNSDYNWIIDNQGTGYVIRTQQIVIIKKNRQQTPDERLSKIQEGDYALTYIDHGKQPQNLQYQYVIFPNADVQKMKEFIENMEGQSALYNILKKDQQAHIIHYIPADVFAFSFFAKIQELDNQFIHSVDQPCLAMIKKEENMQMMTVVHPSTSYLQNSTIKIKLHGSLTVHSTSEQFTYYKQDEFTELQLSPRFGFPIDIQFNIESSQFGGIIQIYE